MPDSQEKQLRDAVKFYFQDQDFHIAQSLIANGVKVTTKDLAGDTPLHAVISGVASKNRDEMATLLIKAGADVNAQNVDGSTPLHKAARFGNTAGAELLMKHEAKVGARDKKAENTPLHEAVSTTLDSAAKMTQLLIDNNADIDAQNKRKETPLHSAHSLPAVLVLLKNGAQLDIKDDKGVTAFDAIQNRFNSESAKQQILEVLQKRKTVPENKSQMENEQPMLPPLSNAVRNAGVKPPSYSLS